MHPKLHRNNRLGAILLANQTRPTTKHSAHKTTHSDLRLRWSEQTPRHLASGKHIGAVDLPQLGPRVHLPSGEPEQRASLHDEVPRRGVPSQRGQGVPRRRRDRQRRLG